MMILQHLIITKFDLKGCDTTQKNERLLTPKEIQNQIVIFEDYCLPSMAQQKNQNFIWLCLFDLDTPAHFKNKFERYTKCCPQFKPICLSLKQDEKTLLEIQKNIRIYIDPKATHLLTTNLDYYHSIHKDMVQDLQKHIHLTKEQAIYNFISSFQFFVHTKLLIKTDHPDNHLQSLFVKNEPKSQHLSSFCFTPFNHPYKTIDIHSAQPMWLEVILSDQENQKSRFINIKNNHLQKKSLDLSAYGLYFTLLLPQFYYKGYIIYLKLYIKTLISKFKKRNYSF